MRKLSPHSCPSLSLHINLWEKENSYLYHVALLSNKQSERLMTDHEKKQVRKTQAKRTEPQTVQRNVLTCI